MARCWMQQSGRESSYCSRRTEESATSRIFSAEELPLWSCAAPQSGHESGSTGQRIAAAVDSAQPGSYTEIDIPF
jgi:hypothetical protein